MLTLPQLLTSYTTSCVVLYTKDGMVSHAALEAHGLHEHTSRVHKSSSTMTASNLLQDMQRAIAMLA